MPKVQRAQNYEQKKAGETQSSTPARQKCVRRGRPAKEKKRDGKKVDFNKLRNIINALELAKNLFPVEKKWKLVAAEYFDVKTASRRRVKSLKDSYRHHFLNLTEPEETKDKQSDHEKVRRLSSFIHHGHLDATKNLNGKNEKSDYKLHEGQFNHEDLGTYYDDGDGNNAMLKNNDGWDDISDED